MFYAYGRKLLLEGTTWTSDNIKVLLVSSSYSASHTHQFVSDVSSYELSGTGYSRQSVTSRSLEVDTSGGYAYADGGDVTWTGINAGTIGMAIVFLDTGVDSTSRLIGAYDVTDLTTNGSDVILRFTDSRMLRL